MPIAFAVAVFVRDGRALLGHRHRDRRWYADCWDLVGGHVEPGETPEEAVRRECREEIGVEIEEFRPLPMAVSDPNLDMSAFLVTQWQGADAPLARVGLWNSRGSPLTRSPT